MGVHCYADDLSLLTPPFTGLQEVLRLCELHAIDHNIIFNAKKRQLLCFSSDPSDDPCTVDLTMLNSQSIQYVKKCIHLGNELCPMNKHVLIDNTVNDLNCRFNNVLADFAHCICSTLSVLFKTYCMNIYGSQIWPYSKNCPSKFYISWRKAIRKLWKIHYRTHNKFIHIINNGMPIGIPLEKRCIKYLWNLINSNCKLYNNIVKLSLNNVSNTIIGENMRYFMYPYDCMYYMIQEYDWYESINIIYNKIDSYMLS